MTSNPKTLEELADYLEQRAKENLNHSSNAKDHLTVTWHAAKAAAYESVMYKVRQMIPPEYPKILSLDGLMPTGCESVGTGTYHYKIESEEDGSRVRLYHSQVQELLNRQKQGHMHTAPRT